MEFVIILCILLLSCPLGLILNQASLIPGTQNYKEHQMIVSATRHVEIARLRTIETRLSLRENELLDQMKAPKALEAGNAS